VAGTAKRHHFVSKFLLAGFTQSGEVTDELWVTDFKTGKQFARTPATTGFQTNFHTVDIEDVEPDHVEQVLAKIEGKCAPSIKAVIRDRKIPCGEAYHELIYFMALMMVKTPKARKVAEHGAGFLNKLLLKRAFRSKETWESVQADMRNVGLEIGEDVVYEEMHDFVNSDGYDFKVDQNWIVYTMMAGAIELMPSLVDRKWSVLCNPEGEFICTDHPACCSFVQEVPAMWSPAPGLPHTEVQFPLSRHIMLMGSLEGPAVTVQVERKHVALFNRRALAEAERFVYSSGKDFIWLGRDGLVKHRPDELVAALRREPDASPPKPKS